MENQRPPEQRPRPRPYVIVTGALFALIALAHFARTIAEWRRFEADPWFALEGPGLGLVCGALAFWAADAIVNQYLKDPGPLVRS